MTHDCEPPHHNPADSLVTTSIGRFVQCQFERIASLLCSANPLGSSASCAPIACGNENLVAWVVVFLGLNVNNGPHRGAT